MTVIEDLTEQWGPLSEPIHPDAAQPGEPVWKDNAYLSFWDVDAHMFGTFHVSTSPNGDGARRARCSVTIDGRVVEIIEELPIGSFTGPSIHFGLDGNIRVDHPDLRAELVNAPLLVPADYSVGGLIPELVPGKPLQHFQQGCHLTGTLEVDGMTHPVDGQGMRDRTWGFRDESAQWQEYAGLVGVFGGSFVTAMKFLGFEGGTRAEGFLVDEGGSNLITDIGFSRNAAAQFTSARLGLEDGTSRTVVLQQRRAGFWVPMGRDTDGPAFGTYDDFMQLELDGRTGAGFFEQGIIHRVH
jgi:hypothetical protein